MFTTRHFWALARAIKADHDTFTYAVTSALADLMAAHNGAFKRAQFMRAAGWEHKPDDAQPEPVAA
jgi:hypothetical protein